MGKLNFGGGAKAAPAKPAAKSGPVKKTASKPAAVEVEAEVVEEEAPAKPAKATKQEIAKPTKQELAKPAANGNSGIVGEIDESDIRLPRLNVVSPTSKLHTEEEFDLGVIVFEKELEIAKKGDSINFVVLQVRKQYQQKLEYGSDEKPQVFDTKEEVEDNGGTTKWSQDAVDEERYYAKIAHIVIAVMAPENLPEDELHRFPMEFDGNNWARAIVTVQGGSFASFGTPIITAAMGKLRSKGGIYHGMWTASTAKKSNGENSWYVFVSKFAGLIEDEEALEFFRELANESIPDPGAADE
jgi:hypothetical protein